MLIAAPPANYEDLIEGQVGCGPPTDLATREARLRLQPGWQNAFGVSHRYFRVVGIKHTLVSLGIPNHEVVKNETYRAGAVGLVPPTWRDRFFSKETWEDYSATQFDSAVLGELQRFDRAALSILYLHKALAEIGASWNLYRFVRLRPVTFYVEGLHQPFFDKHIQGKEAILRIETQQEDSLFKEVAGGRTFVTRKTAELILKTLQSSIRDAEGMSVACGQRRTRAGTTKWIRPSKSEKLHYHEDEYLGPAAWQSLDTTEQSRVGGLPIPQLPVVAR
jgi:hypothetical protein